MAADKHSSWSYTEGLPDEDDILLRARDRSHELGVTPVTPAVGAALTVLAAASKASTAVEVGAGAGVSGVCLLRGLGRNAVLTTIDSDVDHLRAAREAYSEAGIPSNRTRTISRRAADVLPRLTDRAYDLVFIDADKTGYVDYYEAVLPKLAPRGLIVADNTGSDMEGIREFNEHVAADPRTVQVLLTVRDGVTLIRRAGAVARDAPASRAGSRAAPR